MWAQQAPEDVAQGGQQGQRLALELVLCLLLPHDLVLQLHLPVAQTATQSLQPLMMNNEHIKFSSQLAIGF